METGKMYALCILRTIEDCHKTEAELGNQRAIENLKETQLALKWVESK